MKTFADIRVDIVAKGAPPLFKNEDLRVVYGWASVITEKGEQVIDLQDDKIAELTLVKAAHDYVTAARVAKLEHDGVAIGEIVESVVFTDDLQKALGIDLGRQGWFIGMKINDDAIWAAAKRGEFAAFSIGGFAAREEE